ncbi:MAG: hypothetical protein KBS70_08245 [Bacteroidales bacterium]|nr:hypothetical protein [Candidatus Colicola equi]
MTRDEIIHDLQAFFNVRELVCPHVYAKWGEQSWQFLDTAYLHTILVLRRDILRVPLVCNTKTLTQRGFRCNMCELVKEKRSVYVSAHMLGKGGDFTSSEMSAERMRNEIKKQSGKLPYPVRIEGGVSWLHIDVIPQYGVHSKVYEFKA